MFFWLWGSIALPVAQKTYIFKELYIETILRNPKKGRSFRLQVGLAVSRAWGFRVCGLWGVRDEASRESAGCGRFGIWGLGFRV